MADFNQILTPGDVENGIVQLFLQSQQTTVSFHKLWMKMATNWTR